MSGNLFFYLSLSILIPAIICLVRLTLMQQNYRPFAVFIIGGAVSEIVSYLLAVVFRTNIIFLNFYSLFEAVILIYMFHRWGFLFRRTEYFRYLMAIIVVSWIIEVLITSGISTSNRYFSIGYYFIVVMLAIREIDQDMKKARKAFGEPARLLICIGILIFFTFGIVRELFTLFGRGIGTNLLKNVFLVAAIPNVVANIIYGFAAYYIPGKKNWPDMSDTYKREF